MTGHRDNVGLLVPEILLHRYVDVLLSRSQRRAVESAVARDESLSFTIDHWRAQNRGFHRLAAAHPPPPMSHEMTDVVRNLCADLPPRRRNRSWPIIASLLFLAAGTLAWIADPAVNAEMKHNAQFIKLNQ